MKAIKITFSAVAPLIYFLEPDGSSSDKITIITAIKQEFQNIWRDSSYGKVDLQFRSTVIMLIERRLAP